MHSLKTAPEPAEARAADAASAAAAGARAPWARLLWWGLAAVCLALTFLAYLNPHLALDLANRVWACF
jgi:type VI protein secretion system component VasF